jgi:glycosyltransferase involved in cell wall biosynthesis
VVVDGYNGLLVEQQLADALGAKIRLVLEQEPLRTKLSHNALAFAQEQDWGHLTEKMEECYSQAMVNAS